MGPQQEKSSRRQKRKEARQAKNERKCHSWLENQRERKIRLQELDKGSLENSKENHEKKSSNILARENNSSKSPSNQKSGDWQRRKMLYEASSAENNDSGKIGMGKKPGFVKGKMSMKRKGKTKFEEYLEMDMAVADRLAQEDLEMERRLAKRLKVKDGKLGGLDDDINLLFKGIPSLLGSSKGEEGSPSAEDFPIEGFEDGSSQDEAENEVVGAFSEQEETSGGELGQGDDIAGATKKKRQRKKQKSKKKQEGSLTGDNADGTSVPAKTPNQEATSQRIPTKALAPVSGAKYIAPRLRSRAGDESEQHTQIRRRVRGLLNRLSESNVESVTGEIAVIFRSVSHSVGTHIISHEVLAACSAGPRGNEQYAAVFAAFISGMACFVGMDFSAKLIASLAKCFQDEYLKEDNLSLRNLTLLLSYLCIFGVCSSDLIYDFLIMLSERLTEIDVSTILTVLQCCGLKIRGDDPAAMKNFIQSVQKRVNELKASSDKNQADVNGKRMEFMLETILDIKNNKKRPKEETAQQARIKKWLQKLRVEDILIRGLQWSKLLDPDKKGQWWLSGDVASITDNVEEVANTIDKEALEAQKLLRLAASQRMNTDARKAIFCIIMSGEDYLDAYEKLLRLDLPGTQDRDIMRVLVECCLQEKVFNKYYTVLATKLCEHDKNHKFTLQYCLWDHFKEIESMPLLRSMHLARFTTEMVASFTLSLGVLKSVELIDVRQLTAQRIMHFRMLFEFLFEHPDSLVWNVFTRVAVAPELEVLQHGIEFFIREYVVKSNKHMTSKYKLAKKALSNTEGVLM